MSKGHCLPSDSKESKVRIILGSTLASGIVIIGLIFLFCIVVWRKSHKRQRKVIRLDYSTISVPNSSKSHAFTPDEMVAATQNFSVKIRQGGFGSLFWGKLAQGDQIAVKVLSLFSKQGVVQFLNEIDLLSRIHHRNLVSLVGYCNACRDLMLVYEYMCEGSLNDHLYGLEYLHVGCIPKIIHRDVKTANILLDSNLNGKLADFGLSKVAMDEEASHLLTAVRGTAGYLDPKYFTSHMLTAKSDVYSFGVVLLEIISGRRPLDMTMSEKRLELVKWVTPFVKQGEDYVNLAEIVDKRLHDWTALHKTFKLA